MPWMWDGDVRVMLTMLQTVNQQLYRLTQMMERNMSAVTTAMAELTTQVQANTDAEQSATKLITDLADMISKNAGDPTAIQQLAAQLKTSAARLGEAVVANTPHEEAPPEEPAS